jgi:hypothetical protein
MPQQHNQILGASSPRLPSGPLVQVMRIWLPLSLCLIGVALLVIDDFDGFGVSAFAAFAGAGVSIWLANFLWRMGVSGDDEREQEAADRAYLADHGHWPDEHASEG